MIAALAVRQHGVVARWQLLAAGITVAQIRTRLDRARLHEVHRGVYLVGHSVPAPHAHEMAALLACRLEGVLSHRSAAALWELLRYLATAPVQVTVPCRRTLARDGITVHRADLDRRDVRDREGMALTSPPRTVLDLAAELDLGRLELLVADAAYRGLASERELQAQLERNPHKPGNARLRAVLDLPGGPQRTRSPRERSLLGLLRRARITGFEMNAPIAGYEVDVLWRELRFAVELDGYDGHSSRVAFDRDRLKWATLKARGVDVMPLSPRQVRDDPEGVLGRLLAALERARRRRS